MRKIESPQGFEDRLLELKKALRRAGVKATPQRLEIFRMLNPYNDS
jgi:Fe2+ or Zn2+ uptake regulation protein